MTVKWPPVTQCSRRLNWPACKHPEERSEITALSSLRLSWISVFWSKAQKRHSEEAVRIKPEVKGLLPCLQASESLLRSFLFRVAQTEWHENPIKTRALQLWDELSVLLVIQGSVVGVTLTRKVMRNHLFWWYLQESSWRYVFAPPLTAVSSHWRVSGSFASH